MDAHPRVGFSYRVEQANGQLDLASHRGFLTYSLGRFHLLFRL